MHYYVTDNRAACVPLNEIPTAGYAEFYEDLAERLADERYHIGHYFALPDGDVLRAYCLLLDDTEHRVLVASYAIGYYDTPLLPSLTARHPQVHPFEREITERYGVRFADMPWNKPLRFPFDRYDRSSSIDNYPFYTIEGASLHEVNVGPIHAGIIEPGAFRFICNGEQVLHLEIALGYQHRGVERSMTADDNVLRQTLVAESVAGDSAVAHATALRAAARETGRQEGSTGDARPRTSHRARTRTHGHAHRRHGGALHGRGLPAGTGRLRGAAHRDDQHHAGVVRQPFRQGADPPLRHEPSAHGHDDRPRTTQHRRRAAPLRRGAARHQVVAVAALPFRAVRHRPAQRDDTHRRRWAPPHARRASAATSARRIRGVVYGVEIAHEPFVKQQGDVMARLMMRCRETLQSADYVLRLLDACDPAAPLPSPDYAPAARPDALAFGLVEGWRGEICHVALTDAQGALRGYKIKDPSLHNWLALALAVRGEGISDFPICNKSFNLSYCGHDL